MVSDSSNIATMPTFSESVQAWEAAVGHTRRLSPGSFDQWFSGIQFNALEASTLRLTARDEFVRDWVKEHFLPELLRELCRQLGHEGPLHVEWDVSAHLASPVSTTWTTDLPRRTEVDGRARSVPPPSERRTRHDRPADRTEAITTRLTASVERASGRPPASAHAQALIRTQLNPKYTFSNFVVGPTNNLAYAAAKAAGGGGGKRYNPLFIAGGTGLGKTHLMHAIAHRLLESNPSAHVVYVSAEQFTNDFIEALQNHRMEEFRARYRSGCDLLLLDDVQFLAGREQTQEEFFHTFNALHDTDKPIVLTSDKYPQDLARMPERLVSRFNSGLVADVHLPQLETRVAIVKKKAELEGIPLRDEVAVLLAQCIQSNVRELEGALIRLAAKSSLVGQPIDFEFAQAELAMVPPRRQAQMSVADIQKAVCGHFRLSNAELLSKDRHKSVAFARQVAMYLCRQRLKCSFPELGKAFGNRDHTTVMSAVKRVEKLRKQDPQVNAHLEAIEQRLASSDQ